MNKGYRNVGEYCISNICLESYPCQHWVSTNDEKPIMMYGNEIYCMLKNKNISDSHFDQYAEYVKRLNSPTLNKKAKQEWDQSLKRIEKREKEENEKKKAEQSITDNYKASSYLDKLKSKIKKI